MSAPEFDQPPARSDFFKPAEHVGELLDVQFLRYLAGYSLPMTKPGDEGGAEVNVRLLDGPMAGTYYEGAILIQKALRGRLQRSEPNKHILTRLAMGTAAPGQNAPYVFEDYTDEDLRIAKAFYSNQAISNLPPAQTQDLSGNVAPIRQHDYRDDSLHQQAAEATVPAADPNRPPGMTDEQYKGYQEWQAAQGQVTTPATSQDPPF